MKYNCGSQPIPYDQRDERFTEISFGAPQLPVFPKTLGRARHPVKDQGGTLSCTAHATTLASEYQEGIPLSPEWHWMETCRKLGTFIPNGADPRTAMSISNELGDLPAELSPFKLPSADPQLVGNWNEWDSRSAPEAMRLATERYRKAAYVKIPFVHDWFDSIRAALVNGENTDTVVMAFGTWYAEWFTAFIPKEYSSFFGYHAYTFVDFDTIGGVEYLVIQNSWGTQLGDGGFQYMPREVANKEFAKWGTGLYVFHDLTPEMIAEAKKNTVVGALVRSIMRAWEQVMLLLNR